MPDPVVLANPYAPDFAAATASVDRAASAAAPGTAGAAATGAVGGEASGARVRGDDGRFASGPAERGGSTADDVERMQRDFYERAKAMAAGKPDPGDNAVTAIGAGEIKPGANDTNAAAGETTVDTSPAAIAQREAEVLALRALKRDGYSDEDLKDIPRERQVALGKKAQERQSKLDDEFKRLKGGKPSGSDSPEDGDDEAGDTAASSAPSQGRQRATRRGGDDGEQAEAATRPAEHQLDEALLEEFADPDSARKLRKQWNRLTKDLTAAQAAREQAGQELQAMRAEVLDTRSRLIQRELAATFKAIPAEGEPPAEFMQQLGKLVQRGGYTPTLEGIRELMTDAAHIAFGPAVRQQAQADLIDESRKLAAGQPTRATSHDLPGRTLSADQEQRLMYEASKRFSGSSDRAGLHDYFQSLRAQAQAA